MGPDLNNLQNLVVNGYKRPLSRHRWFHFPEGSHPNAFVKRLLEWVPSAAKWDERPPNAVHLAFSAGGLRRLRVLSEEALRSFQGDFLKPPNLEELRESPDTVYWRGVPYDDLHCLVSSWSEDAEQDGLLANKISAAAEECGVIEKHVIKEQREIQGALLGNSARVHFGFRDAITKPKIAWTDDNPPPEGSSNFRHVVVGYGTPQIPSSPNTFSSTQQNLHIRQEAVDFAQDGSYLAFTLIEQDVPGFNSYLENQAAALVGAEAAPGALEEKKEWLAAKILGRWRDGTPLALSPDNSQTKVPDDRLNDFDYSADKEGLRCPFTAHIRITNPRSQPLFPARGPTPTIVRRGMPYGPELLSAADDPSISRGLIGLFICSSLTVQFIKLVQWMNQSDFSPAFKDRLQDDDPLMGNRTINKVSEFHIPAQPQDLVLKSLPKFTTTLGTAFLFLPSMAALQKISAR
jgi:Dyp-type peroxidase family